MSLDNLLAEYRGIRASQKVLALEEKQCLKDIINLLPIKVGQTVHMQGSKLDTIVQKIWINCWGKIIYNIIDKTSKLKWSCPIEYIEL